MRQYKIRYPRGYTRRVCSTCYDELMLLHLEAVDDGTEERMSNVDFLDSVPTGRLRIGIRDGMPLRITLCDEHAFDLDEPKGY